MGTPIDRSDPRRYASPMDGLPDIHRHLDGSLRAVTIEELASERGFVVPPNLAFSKGMGLEGALEKFAFTLSLIQNPDEVGRVAREICEDAAAEGVTTLEIRFAPQLHKGAPVEEITDAALDGIAGRAGLVLCGLFGEDPDVLMNLVRVARTRPGVTGIDIAGAPSPAHEHRLESYAAVFREAGEAGLGRTVHAGEGRSPLEIRSAILDLGATRIGHGTTLLDDPWTLELVVERGIVIEACPTSNMHTGAIPDLEAHPLPAWLRMGVRATVCTDNTLLSATDPKTEYRRAREIPGMDDELLARAIANGHAGAFRRS